jgi:hypothetical protein
MSNEESTKKESNETTVLENNESNEAHSLDHASRQPLNSILFEGFVCELRLLKSNALT